MEVEIPTGKGVEGDKMGENDIGGESKNLPKTFFQCNGKNVGVGTSPARLCEKWDPVFWDEEWDLGKRMWMDISWISSERCLVKGRGWDADRSGWASERMRWADEWCEVCLGVPWTRAMQR